MKNRWKSTRETSKNEIKVLHHEAEIKVRDKYNAIIDKQIDDFNKEIDKLKSQFNESRVQIVLRDAVIRKLTKILFHQEMNVVDIKTSLLHSLKMNTFIPKRSTIGNISICLISILGKQPIIFDKTYLKMTTKKAFDILNDPPNSFGTLISDGQVKTHNIDNIILNTKYFSLSKQTNLLKNTMNNNCKLLKRSI